MHIRYLTYHLAQDNHSPKCWFEIEAEVRVISANGKEESLFCDLIVEYDYILKRNFLVIEM